MHKLFFLPLLVLIATPSLPSPVTAQEPAEAATDQNSEAARHFEFSYGAAINDLPDGAKVKVWFPIAETNQQQTVDLRTSSTPGELKVNRDAAHQNQIGSFEFTADQQSQPKFMLTYDVQRQPASPYRDAADADRKTVDTNAYLKANSTVPITGKPIDLIKGMTLPSDSKQKGRKLYDLVFQHMDYDKSKPGYGNGDSVWACDSKTGNCTDFHSLFISLSRNQSLAAKFEIGFPLPTDRNAGKIGGYHCWAWFLSPEEGWVPVDISEADKHPEMKDRLFGSLPSDRIAFSTGRDIVLVPASEAGPQNFFVYPHVEVDGQIWPKEKIELDFSFKNQ